MAKFPRTHMGAHLVMPPGPPLLQGEGSHGDPLGLLHVCHVVGLSVFRTVGVENVVGVDRLTQLHEQFVEGPFAPKKDKMEGDLNLF